MTKNILEVIRNAEAVLVSVGDEFSPKITESEDALTLFRISDRLSKTGKESRELRAYEALRKLLFGKPYFIVNMNDDGLIYRSDLIEQFIVSPCGNLTKMQCGEHIIDAGAVREKVLQTGDVSLAVCPECGRPLSFHSVSIPGYMESGYLDKWQNYKNFLQGSMNRPICLLELGVGFRFPQVVRLPFERAAFYNKNSHFIRIHQKFPQIPEELADRGISLGKNALDWLLELNFD